MKRIVSVLPPLLLAAMTCHLFADVSIENTGRWPDTWPKELEPLRANSRTIEGPLGGQLHYEISFTERDAFESAWRHLLKVKSPETPLFLIRSPYIGTGARQGATIKAGVLINSHPFVSTNSDGKEADKSSMPASKTILVLVVDGNVIDLNRIPLPPNTHIQDDRFKDEGITKR